MHIELLRVESEAHWEIYHSIRRHVLYELRGRSEYDEKHPDEHKRGNTPLLFLRDGEPVGTVRLDQDNKRELGIVRLVAILPTYQRQGFGTAMMRAVEKLAVAAGMKQLLVHAAYDAVPFYEKLGWTIIDATKTDPLMTKRIA